MLTTVVFQANAQNFPGYRTGNYTGVNGVFFNPANIADSRYRWDVNLFSVNAFVGNNKGEFKLKDITSTESGNFEDRFLDGNGNTNANINADVHGPSVLFNLNKKSAMAITTRARVVSNLKDFDGNLINSVVNTDDNSYPYTFSSGSNSRIINNAWSEIGVAYAREIKTSGPHFIKGGITLKYLSGAANNFLQINKINTTINEDLLQDSYLEKTTGGIAIGSAGVDIVDFEVSDFLGGGNSGIGADIGFVYEFRPLSSGISSSDRHLNKYKFKAALSLMDLGKIKYTAKPNNSAGYNINITGTNRFYLAQLEDKSTEEVKAILDANPAFFTPISTGVNGEYSASLPTVLQAEFDYHLHRGFYLNAGMQFNMVEKSSIYSANQYNSFSVTPRYEGKAFGVYLPLNYNELTKFNAGISLRAGPLFFGSGSIITAIAKSKQADAHIGLRFGILHKAQRERAAQEVPVPAIAQRADRDGDGIFDDEDSCPDVKGLASLKGCPDADADGISDAEDQCPAVAGLAKYNGCPVPDTDSDGVNDDEDKCPTVKGLARLQGCPVQDTDGDGVNDEEDKCVNRAGPLSNMGCPVIAKEVTDKINTAAQSIFFATGSAKILPKSFASLNDVVAILKADESLNLTADGYTDNTGSEEKNLVLSEERSVAVITYIASKGIAESRLSSDGHGIDNPVADNKTAAGRAKNRRVELNVKNY